MKDKREELERLKLARAYALPQSRHTKRKRRKRERYRFQNATQQDYAVNVNRKREAPPIQT